MKFKPFQIDQIARGALVDGLIGDWEPGLGKMIFALAWPLIKQARRCLLVVPGQLHRQFRAEALEKFGVHLSGLRHHGQLQKFGLHLPLLTHHSPGCSTQNTRFFITSYHDLGHNNTKGGAVPPLARYLSDLEKAGAGFDCVVIDEGTRLQANETHVAEGVRCLRPKYRLVLTGTPIKNRLESIYWLLWWVAGARPEAHQRFPYPGTKKARELFANQHLMIETGEEGASRTARVTNIHHLWEIIAPLLIRMRKADCGVDLPPKILKPVVLQPGTAQAAVYRQHLLYPPLFSQRNRPLHGRNQAAMQINLLRQAALCPHAAALGKVRSGGPGPRRSWIDFNPKLAANLALVADLLNVGEQVLIGSPFREYSDALHYRLREAGVSALLLDGRMPPPERGELVEAFKSGHRSVLVAGLEAMGEGYNLDNCANIILPSLTWAMDVNEQFVHRIWRLTSTRPVTIYTLVLAGTIDERLYESFAEKSTSAQMAIDRELFHDTVEEIDLSKLLKQAVRCFDAGMATIDEDAMEEQWTVKLRSRLAGAEARYREWHPPIVADRTGNAVSKTDVALAMASLDAPAANPLAVKIHRERNRRGAKPVDWNAVERTLKREL